MFQKWNYNKALSRVHWGFGWEMLKVCIFMDTVYIGKTSNFYAQYNIMMIRRFQWDVEFLVHCNDTQISPSVSLSTFIYIRMDCGWCFEYHSVVSFSHGNKYLPTIIQKPFYDYKILCVLFNNSLKITFWSIYSIHTER